MQNQFQRQLARLYLTIPTLTGIGFFFVSASSASRLFAARDAFGIAGYLLFYAGLFVFAGLAGTAWLHPERLDLWIERLRLFVSKEPLYWTLVAVFGLGSAAGLYFFPFNTTQAAGSGEICFVQMASPYPWFVLLAVQSLIFLRILRHGTRLGGFAANRRLWMAFIVVLGVLLTGFVLILVTRIGLQRDPVDWGIPGVPLLMSQVILSLLICLAAAALGGLLRMVWHWLRQGKPSAPPRWAADAAICLCLWVFAVWSWGSQPVQPSWFNPKPQPPNLEYYPYSDAIHYDMSAQRLLLGSGFEPDVIRPMYSGFLALAQGVSGIDYQQVVRWQTLVLGLIPAALYLLGKELHHRLSGILLGLLAILHESNAIALMGSIDVSTSKMYMSELPAQLGVILFCLFTVAWLKDPRRRKIAPFLAGGVLGISLLVRTQVFLILPVLPLLGLLAYRKQPGLWLQGSLLLAAGLAASLAPWALRNWTTSRSVLSDPEPAGVLFRYDTFAPEAAQALPGETKEAYELRAKSAIKEALLAQPGKAAGVVAGHYINSHLASLFILPTSYPVPALAGSPNYTPCSGAFWLSFVAKHFSTKGYIQQVPYWSGAWEMDLPLESRLPLLASLLLFGLGIAASWEHARVGSLAPLLIAALYNIANAGSRLSGWRFNQPVEWVGMLFFAIGCGQVLLWLWMLFSNRQVPIPAENISIEAGERPLPWKGLALAGISFILITATIPFAERVIPNPFLELTTDSILLRLEQKGLLQEAGLDLATARQMVGEPGAIAYTGRALYPRHYPGNQGEISARWPVYIERNYPRLGFLLAPQKAQVILPLRKPPRQFPNGMDVFVLGCQRPDHVQAYLVASIREPEQVIAASFLEDWTCASP
jgi:hypothetical protein